MAVDQQELVGTIQGLAHARSLAEIQAITRRLAEFALAAEWPDSGICGHTERVALTSRTLAESLRLSERDALLIYLAAPLHDVGKLAVPETLLLKPGALTADEFEEVQCHTTTGAAILSGGWSEVIRVAEEIALTHHEWWDGRGYPAGLAGEAIPTSGRIVALADVFDALTHERPYKEAWPVEEAVAEIRELKASQFDPDVVEAFLELDPQELVDLPPDVSGPSGHRMARTDRWTAAGHRVT